MGWAKRLGELLRPAAYLRSVIEIRPEWLTSCGKRAVLVDLDNTLTGWRSREVDPGIAAWAAAMKAEGLGLCILSNSRFPRRVRAVGERLGIPAIAWAGKPGRSGFRRALKLLDCRSEEAVVVGDQLFTDVLGANRMGIMSVLVEPLTSHEFIGNRLTRMLERRILRRLGYTASTGLRGLERAGT